MPPAGSSDDGFHSRSPDVSFIPEHGDRLDRGFRAPHVYSRLDRVEGRDAHRRQRPPAESRFRDTVSVARALAEGLHLLNIRRAYFIQGREEHMVDLGSRPALIVIDMQNGFCHPDGFMNKIDLDYTASEAAVEPISRLLAASRAARIPIFFTRYSLNEDYSDAGLLLEVFPAIKEARGMIRQTWDADVVDELTAVRRTRGRQDPLQRLLRHRPRTAASRA